MISTGPSVLVDTTVRPSERASTIARLKLSVKDEETNKLMYSVDIDTASTMREFIAGPTKKIVINFDYVNVNLPTGNYEVIPYFMIDRKDIPQGILSALGAGYNTFSENFFNFPFYRTGGKLVVQ